MKNRNQQSIESGYGEDSAENRKRMLRRLQLEMNKFHATRNRRHRMLRVAGFCSIGLLLFAAAGYGVFRFSQAQNGPPFVSGNQSILTVQAIWETGKLHHHHFTRGGHGEDLGAKQVAGRSNGSEKPEYVSERFAGILVSNAEVSPRGVEAIGDDELIALLKASGIKAWIGEIGGRRVVLTESGRAL